MTSVGNAPIWSAAILLDGKMERIEAELFTDGGNAAVVRLPGRRFPGVVIQGDSLSVIRGDIAELRDACGRSEVGEAKELAELLLGDFDNLLTRYTAALSSHGNPRPF